MKLLYCTECKDVFRMFFEERSCFCGKTKGNYIDNLNAVFSGPAIPLGFHNTFFYNALENQPESGWGKTFEAFVIQKDCPTFKKKG